MYFFVYIYFCYFNETFFVNKRNQEKQNISAHNCLRSDFETPHKVGYYDELCTAKHMRRYKGGPTQIFFNTLLELINQKRNKSELTMRA